MDRKYPDEYTVILKACTDPAQPHMLQSIPCVVRFAQLNPNGIWYYWLRSNDDSGTLYNAYPQYDIHPHHYLL